MENFVLYEELGKGDSSIIYKGRRKGTINFVAIHCIDKCKRPEVTNTVRMTHDIEHENVVKFHEWYETSNHLWLVVELCNGGSLENLINQDGNLPESSICAFGIQLVTGLHYIHSLSILFHDLTPSKILLDTSGVLKYADFGLSKVEGENLEELFLKFAEAGDQWNTQSVEEMMTHIKCTGSTMYLAPELIHGREPSFASDLWSLGCILYTMYAGHPPFLAESEDGIKERIVSKEMPIPKVKGSRLSAKPSPEFLNLLQGLLKKNPTERIGWKELINHHFWQGELSALAKDLSDTSHDVQASHNTVGASSVFEHSGGSSLGRIKGVDMRRSLERPVSNLDVVDGTSRPGTAGVVGDYLRPKTAPGLESGGSLFTLSARPHTAVPPDERVTSPHKPIKGPLTTREAIGYTTDGEASLTDNGSETKRLIFHDSDFVVTQIVDNPKIQKVTQVKYDSKILPVPPFNVEKLSGLSNKEILKHAKSIADNIAQSEKGPPSQKRIQLLHYITHVASCRPLSTALVQQDLISTLGKQIRESTHLDMKLKMCRILALTAHFTSELNPSTSLSETMSSLSEMLRENTKNTKLKHSLLPALGEVISLVAIQEQRMQEPIDCWSVPSIAYTTIIRSIREGEDQVLNHMATKVVETVTATNTSHAQKFVTPEVCQSLWYLFKHSAIDAVKCTSISALCRMTWHNPSIFQTVLDAGGLTSVMQALIGGVSRVQQAIITMIGVFMVSVGYYNRLFQDKDFQAKLMRCFESPSSVIRGKAFVVIYEMVHNNNDLLLACCQARLVMYIERDSRRQTPRTPKVKPQEAQEYLSQCLDLLVSGIVQRTPAIMDEILECLNQVEGRKHPSATQVRQLKSSLPLVAIFNHLITSQVFRGYIISRHFLDQYVKLLTHVAKIESGQTNVESASASISVSDFVHSSLSLLEGISQHPSLLILHNQIIMEQILPQLASLMGCQNVDTKGQALHLFGEIASVFLTQDQFGNGEAKVDLSKLHDIITERLLPLFEPILLDIDPLPSYGLKLLLALLEHNNHFIRQFESQGLVVVIFQVLMDHQNNPFGRVVQGAVTAINYLVSHKETNMRDLYDQGLVDHVISLIFEFWGAMCEGEEGGRDVKAASQILLTLLDTVHSILKYVSEVVRKAIQMKNKGGDNAHKEAEFGEKLLMMNKALTDLTTLLIQMLCYEDNEVQDLSIRCLSLLVQLFGGEHKDAMCHENMECFSKSLMLTESRKQKVLLRVIKRLLTTDSQHVTSMRKHGDVLRRTIQSLADTASSHADISLSTVAAEILKMTGHLQ